MGRLVPLDQIQIDPALQLRDGLDEGTIERYMEWFRAGRSKAVILQRGTNRLIEGFHRYEAARRLGLREIWAEEKDVPEHRLLAEAFRLNRDHGLPLSRQERDRAIARLYYECGLTQTEIARLAGLTQQGVSRILAAVRDTINGNPDHGDKRVRLPETLLPAVARLLLQGASHQEVADRFGVARSTVTERWNEFREAVRAAYEAGALKREVAERFRLDVAEVDAILRQFDPEPLNFSPASGSLWTGFRIDERFGRRHPGNLPAELVRNLLYFFSRPGAVLLDPFAGGGVVLDVAADMVGRKAYGYDLAPVREDIAPWDILEGPPPCPEEPDLIFLDPPYSLVAAGKYQSHPHQLGDLPVDAFLDALTRVFGYWPRGRIVLLMTDLRRAGRFVPLSVLCARRLEAAGWTIIDRVVNELHRPSSETGVAVARERKTRHLRGTHVDIWVADRDAVSRSLPARRSA